MTWLSWFFPMWLLLLLARRRGAVTFQEVAGIGWQCSVRPPTKDSWKRGVINSWIGEGRSLRSALRASLVTSWRFESESGEGDPTHAPKLGGEEFDPE